MHVSYPGVRIATAIVAVAVAGALYVGSQHSSNENRPFGIPLVPAAKRREFGPGLIAWTALYLVALPAVAGTFFPLKLQGKEIDGLAVFGVTFLINSLYLLAAWFIVSFGIDRIVEWCGRALVSNWQSVIEGLARGIPMLLVFATFFLLTAETWQVVYFAQPQQFVTLCALLVGSSTCALLVHAVQQVDNGRRFSDRKTLKNAALKKEESDRDLLSAVVTGAENRLDFPVKVSLRGLQWVNAVAFSCTFQLLVLIPITLATWTVFYIIAKLVVTHGIATEWIFGDSPTDAQKAEVAEKSLGSILENPWLKVPTALSLFSLLYLLASLAAGQQGEFSKGGEQALRRRLAVLASYSSYPTSQSWDQCEKINILSSGTGRGDARVRHPG